MMTIIPLILLLGACSAAQREMNRNNDGLLQLDIGMSKQEVMSVMGKPNLNEAYESINGDR